VLTVPPISTGILLKQRIIITTAGNKTVLGLLVDSNTLEANNNNKIEVTTF
jgi:hypothetical protein